MIYLAIGFAALGAVGLFISTLTEQPIGAMIAIVILNVGMFILDSIPQLSWLSPWLLTHWWTSFADLFRTPILWTNVARGTVTALVYLVVELAVRLGPVQQQGHHQLTAVAHPAGCPRPQLLPNDPWASVRNGDGAALGVAS